MERNDEQDDRVQAAAEAMESDIQEMERQSEEVGEHIDDAKSDWSRKRDDDAVPGAEPDDSQDAGEDVAGDGEGEGPAADEAGQ
jgi:hypothetical protein